MLPRENSSSSSAAGDVRNEKVRHESPKAAWQDYVDAEGQEMQRARGANGNPANRFEKLHVEFDPIEPNESDDERPAVRTQFLRDATKTIIARNDSPDVGFERSINPYRGCEHGCAYCFARPTHEYLGFSAGLDFETRIMVKENAPELLEAELSSPKWKPQPVFLSGVTDPYQPVEKKLRLTRRCLEVLAQFRNPVGIITKNRLVTRDIDIFKRLAEFDAISVNISVTSLDRKLQRILEPRTSPPQARLDAVAQLHAAGIRVGVMVAPIIPGLTDHEVPKIVEACGKAGAQSAGYVILRLPWSVAPVFERWVDEHFPDRKEKIFGRVRAMRGGGERVYDSRWSTRQTGEGIFAQQIEAMFEVAKRRSGIGSGRSELSTAHFRRPNEQLSFGL